MRLLLKGIVRFLTKILSPIVEEFLKLSVARGIVVSFGVSILIGSGILYFFEGGKLSYINSLYLAASAFCVTGLSPIPISTLSFPSQVLLLFFIQMGGLGIIVVTVLIGLLVINNLSRNTKLHDFITEVIDVDTKNIEKFNQETKFDNSKIIRVIISILNITITIEGLGFLALYYTLPEVKDLNRIFLAIFTTISAFNNAGFSLLDDITFISHDPIPQLIIATLIIIGGIGYPVIIFIEKFLLHIIKGIFSKLEVFGETYVMRTAIQGKDPSSLYILLTKITYYTENRIEDYNLSLTGESNRIQTKIILYGTLSLIFIGLFLILLMEFNNPNTIGNFSLVDKISNSLLLSVSCRTAGFNTFTIANINDPTLVLICLLMFVGGGPQGTAGGIKITTFVILAKYLINVLNSQGHVDFSGNTVSKKSVAMSTRLYFLATSSLASIILLLSFINGNNNILHSITFEVISAFSTVGLSLGLTSSLGDLEKIIYVLLMYIGRIGIFTVLIAVTGNTATSFEEDDGLKIQVG